MSGEIHRTPGAHDLHPAPGLAPGRDCSDCGICCRVFNVPELNKPGGTWCKHCVGHVSCGIHPTRPQVCRDFYCFYLREPVIPDYWKPNQSHMVIVMDYSGMRTVVHVDPDHPEAWKREPYYRDLKTWSRNHIQTDRQVHVRVGTNCFAILPDRDVDLGEGKGRMILSKKILTPEGPSFEFELIAADDPRAAQVPDAGPPPDLMPDEAP